MISWWVALVLLLLSLVVRLCGIVGWCLTLLFVHVIDYSRCLARVSSPLQRSPLWPASWLLVLDKSRGSKAAEVQRVWDVYDDRLQLMSLDDALNLDDSLARGDVSLAWLIWSSAVLLRLRLLMLIVLRVVLSLTVALCWVGVFFGLVLFET